jgi:hypothetical protein
MQCPNASFAFWTPPPIDENFQLDALGELKRKLEVHKRYVDKVKNVAELCGIPVFDLYGACLAQVGYTGEGNLPGALGMEGKLSSITHDGIIASQHLTKSRWLTLAGEHLHTEAQAEVMWKRFEEFRRNSISQDILPCWDDVEAWKTFDEN